MTCQKREKICVEVKILNSQVPVMFVSCHPWPDVMRDWSHSVFWSNRIELYIPIWPELQINTNKLMVILILLLYILWPWDWIGLGGELKWWAHPSIQGSPTSFVNFSFDWENVASGARVANLLNVRSEGSLGWKQHLPLHGIETFAVHWPGWVQLPLHPPQVVRCWGAIRKQGWIHPCWGCTSSYHTILAVHIRKLGGNIKEGPMLTYHWHRSCVPIPLTTPETILCEIPEVAHFPTKALGGGWRGTVVVWKNCDGRLPSCYAGKAGLLIRCHRVNKNKGIFKTFSRTELGLFIQAGWLSSQR